MCLAVWLTYSARTTADRILAIVPPISAFVAAGFEHSIANMYFVPYAIFVAPSTRTSSPPAGSDPTRRRSRGLPFSAATCCRSRIGNIIGGSVLVGAVYWFVYLRPRGAASPTLFMNGQRARRTGPVAVGGPRAAGSVTHSPDSPLFERRTGLGGPTALARAGAAHGADPSGLRRARS